MDKERKFDSIDELQRIIANVTEQLEGTIVSLTTIGQVQRDDKFLEAIRAAAKSSRSSSSEVIGGSRSSNKSNDRSSKRDKNSTNGESKSTSSYTSHTSTIPETSSTTFVGSLNQEKSSTPSPLPFDGSITRLNTKKSSSADATDSADVAKPHPLRGSHGPFALPTKSTKAETCQRCGKQKLDFNFDKFANHALVFPDDGVRCLPRESDRFYEEVRRGGLLLMRDIDAREAQHFRRRFAHNPELSESGNASLKSISAGVISPRRRRRC